MTCDDGLPVLDAVSGILNAGFLLGLVLGIFLWFFLVDAFRVYRYWRSQMKAHENAVLDSDK